MSRARSSCTSSCSRSKVRALRIARPRSCPRSRAADSSTSVQSGRPASRVSTMLPRHSVPAPSGAKRAEETPMPPRKSRTEVALVGVQLRRRGAVGSHDLRLLAGPGSGGRRARRAASAPAAWSAASRRRRRGCRRRPSRRRSRSTSRWRRSPGRAPAGRRRAACPGRAGRWRRGRWSGRRWPSRICSARRSRSSAVTTARPAWAAYFSSIRRCSGPGRRPSIGRSMAIVPRSSPSEPWSGAISRSSGCQASGPSRGSMSGTQPVARTSSLSRSCGHELHQAPAVGLVELGLQGVDRGAGAVGSPSGPSRRRRRRRPRAGRCVRR